MHVRVKNKRKEAGFTPENWSIVALGDIMDFRNGVNADRDAYGSGVKFVNVMEVIANAHLRSSQIPGRISLPKTLINAFAVESGDVLFNRTSETQHELGLASVFMDSEDDIVFGGFVIRGRTKNYSLDSTYSGYGLRSSAVRSQIMAKGQGAIRANIGQADLRMIALPLPPIAEQRAIATTLSDVDALINSLDRLIAKKRDIKQATMQQLLTGKTRLPGFMGEWECKCLGDLFSITAGGDFDPKLSSATRNEKFQYPVYSNSLSNYGFYGYCTYAAQSAGSITVTARGTLGAANYRSHDFTAIGRVLILKPKEELDGLYFAEYINNRIQFAIESTGVPQLTAPQISKYQIEFPVYKEQIEISRVLTVMAQELMALEKRRDKTLMLKQGMMQELLTGRTRLV